MHRDLYGSVKGGINRILGFVWFQMIHPMQYDKLNMRLLVVGHGYEICSIQIEQISNRFHTKNK